MKDGTVYVNGIGSDASLVSEIKDLFLRSTHDLEWLSLGEVVLLKPALNSSYPYPSTTHPLALQVVSEILEDHGAKVIIGDQSGIRNVLHDSRGVIRGRTRDNYIKAGMGMAGDSFIGFEEWGWEEGFIHHESRHTPSWPNGFYITRWIEEADHIISLPRLSSHTQAGATLGFKNMVGCLRDDSRMEFHANGPYNYLIRFNAFKGHLKSVDDHSGKFFEKIVEISDAMKDKLRLTLFVSTKAQTTFGPDAQVLHLDKLKFAQAHVMEIKPGLVFASQDQVAAESFALALLKYLRRSLPVLARLYERLILFSSNNALKVDALAIRDHPYIRHSEDMGFGRMASEIEYKNVLSDLQDSLNDILQL